jgi:hypothetical protein
VPLQNRVTPFGRIEALAQRGLFTGNRGIIHDPATKTLLKRRWTTKAWLICVLSWKDRRREVMARQSWTELFFLDEATALAAGHRPCFYCRRGQALLFRAAFAAATGGPLPYAAEMDAVLHAERRQPGSVIGPPFGELPDGAMVAAGESAFVAASGQLLLWSVEGYRVAEPPPVAVRLITPPSTLAALRAGYRPVLHPSALSVHA